MVSSKSVCPVPFDQQPLNEYLSLKKSWLFSWSISSQRKFVLGLFYIFVVIFILFNLFIFVLYPFNYLSSNLLLSAVIASVILLFIMLRLYLGWSYIVKRLLSATVFYEESGWYDGQVWIKTSDYLIQDRLIGLYQVIPFIVRIKYTCLILLFNFVFIYLFYWIF
uniref:Ycf36 n=1 Tax=Polysiphonia scopulorum TaxID=257860 RepID=A0A1Z1MIN6_9FLOR|nr:hypothetical protein [Polysiphonia scopulorum]ARW65611.1 hypothetical protein [Polysiphonia scopulorum]